MRSTRQWVVHLNRLTLKHLNYGQAKVSFKGVFGERLNMNERSVVPQVDAWLLSRT